jgi:4-amino-4-deoxy-L-arabinose transferase-like glycosyltransferase
MRPRGMVPIVASLAALAAHLLGNPHYGFFRDELYFIVCGRHPALGYVDQPPLVPLLAAFSQAGGPSLFLLRAIPALFSAASVYVTCLLARELGGGAFAQGLAAMVAFLSPVLMSFGMKVSTDTPGLLLWPLAALLLLRLVKGADAHGWLALGAVLGLAAESKYSVIFFIVALVAGLLLTPQRRALWTPWLLAGIGVAVLIALPNLLWQALQGFPMWELLQNGQHGKNVVLSPLAFLGTQLLIHSPVLALVWVPGLVVLLRRPEARFLGLGYLILMTEMIVLHSKHYYPADVYPVLFAAGGVALENVTAAVPRLRVAVVGVLAVLGSVLVPYTLPVLPIPTFLAYHARVAPLLHLDAAKTEHLRMGPLPQDWADMQGWPELAAAVAGVYRALPEDQRAKAAILADNYGEAAALDFFGPALGLPPVISGHNQYFLWGPRGYDGSVLIDVNASVKDDAKLCETAALGATFVSPLSMPYESRFDIVLCRGLKVPVAEFWRRQKMFK